MILLRNPKKVKMFLLSSSLDQRAECTLIPLSLLVDLMSWTPFAITQKALDRDKWKPSFPAFLWNRLKITIIIIDYYDLNVYCQ